MAIGTVLCLSIFLSGYTMAASKGRWSPAFAAECANAGLHPGRCRGACRTPEGCHCDVTCRLYQYCDCCHDVPNGCRRKDSLSSVQEQSHTSHNTQSNNVINDAEMLERRLLHYLLSSQNDQRKPDRLPTAKFSEEDMYEH